ncbi:molybdenum cofactor synthesis domain-containing protein [Candidatus Hydrogenedentota bacterium]
MAGIIVSVNISKEKGTIKGPVPEIVLNQNGVRDDAHAGPTHRQVSLLASESMERFGKEVDRKFVPGEFAENITTGELCLTQLAVLDRIAVGDVELEVTQIGKKCHAGHCAIFEAVGSCIMPKEGIFCRVISGGAIKAGDEIEMKPRPLRIHVVTVSDRASLGLYKDLSGPKIVEILNSHFLETPWHTQVNTSIVPDDAESLEHTLRSALENDADIIITTGGTGVGPRDITPEVVSTIVKKTMPGIMENVRLKFGADKPNALLSRSIAGVHGETQIYALPGSVRAVQEYMGEILKTMEHLILMIHGIDAH